MVRSAVLVSLAAFVLLHPPTVACPDGNAGWHLLDAFLANSTGNHSLPPDGVTLSSHDKRWYSVPEFQYDWPDVQHVGWLGQSWPKVEQCAGYPIPFCFTDERSLNHGRKALTKGLARWGYLLKYSGLQFSLEGLSQDPPVYCSDASIGPDTVHVTDHTIPIETLPDDRWKMLAQPGCQTRASLGFLHGRTKGRLFLHWCSLTTDLFGAPLLASMHPDLIRDIDALAWVSMAHELGHVMGLKHEHQRPDRDTFLDCCECPVMYGYNAGVANLMSDPKNIFTGTRAALNLDGRIKAMCTEYAAAAAYLPGAIAWMKEDALGYPSDHQFILDHAKRSRPFDYDSIMMYGSWSQSIVGLDTFGDAIYTRKDTRKGMFRGGSFDYAPKDVAISVGDLARLVKLYPREVEVPGMLDVSEWEPMIVGLHGRDMEELQTVVHPPKPHNTSSRHFPDAEGETAPWYEVVDQWVRQEKQNGMPYAENFGDWEQQNNTTE